MRYENLNLRGTVCGVNENGRNATVVLDTGFGIHEIAVLSFDEKPEGLDVIVDPRERVLANETKVIVTALELFQDRCVVRGIKRA